MPYPLQNPIFPLNNVIKTFLGQLDNQMDVNFMTQGISPYTNRDISSNHGSGSGLNTLQSRLVSCDSAGNVTAVYQYVSYLRYVDIGVMKGVKAGEVNKQRNARFKARYVRMWDPESGDTHRPAIMIELRHFQTRLRKYLVDFYGWEGGVRLVQTLDDARIIKLFDV